MTVETHSLFLARRQYSAWIREEDVLSLAGSQEIRGTGPHIQTIRPIFSGSISLNHIGIASDVWKMLHLGLHPDETPDAEAHQALQNVC